MQPPTQPDPGPAAPAAEPVAVPAAPVGIVPAPTRVFSAPGLWAWLVAGLAIALVILVAYSKVYHVPFYFDDRQGITDNDTIEVLWPPWQALNAPKYWCSGAVGRPLVNFSLAVNYQISEAFSADKDGRDPWSYHAYNLLVHFSVALLLLAVLWRTLRMPALAARFGEDAFPLAFLISIVWAAHPLVTETVTNPIQRNESMVSFFYLLVIYCFLRSVEAPKGASGSGKISRAFWWQLAAVVACYLGVLSKELMFSAPLMVYLYDSIFVTNGFLAPLLRRWRFYAAMATHWILLGWLVHHYDQRGGTVGFDLPMSKWEYLLKQCQAITTYFKLAYWPHPLVLDYGYDVVQHLTAVLPQAIFLVALFLASAWGVVRKSPLGFAGAWVFIILAPSSSILPLTTQTEAEHRMYLPLVAFAAMTLLGLYALAGRRIFYAGGALVLFFAAVTYARNQDYHTETAMWLHNVAEAPDNQRAHYNLGCALLNEGRYIDAISEFQLTLKIEPDYADAHTNIGACFANLGDEPTAMKEYEAALAINASDLMSNYNLGCCYWNLQDYDKAATYLRTAITTDPTYTDAQFSLGAVYVLGGHSDKALDPLKTALDSDPHNTRYLAYYGTALQDQGLLDNAIAIFKKGLTIDPDSAELHQKLAGAYADANRLDDALAEDAAALRISPNDAEILHQYGEHLFQNGQFDDAVTQLKLALQQKSEYPEAENDLGSAYMRLNRHADARAAYTRALNLNPAFAEARYNFAVALIADNQLVQAETQLRQTITSDPDYAEAHNQLGLLLKAETRSNEAISQFQDALRIDPDFAEASKNLQDLQDELNK